MTYYIRHLKYANWFEIIVNKMYFCCYKQSKIEASQPRDCNTSMRLLLSQSVFESEDLSTIKKFILLNFNDYPYLDSLFLDLDKWEKKTLDKTQE